MDDLFAVATDYPLNSSVQSSDHDSTEPFPSIRHGSHSDSGLSGLDLTTGATFLNNLVRQNQLLACLHWLCEFEILPCIPRKDMVPTADLAALTGVPERQLHRVVSLMATVGFLHQPLHGHVAHTASSVPFVADLALRDAAMFAAEVVAPAALSMATATKRNTGSQHTDVSSFALALGTSYTFAEMCDRKPKIQRQLHAYLMFTSVDHIRAEKEVLLKIDWKRLIASTVIDVGAPSCALVIFLAGRFPSLRFIVQQDADYFAVDGTGQSSKNTRSPAYSTKFSSRTTTPLSGMGTAEILAPELQQRIQIQQRPSGSIQSLTGADVYLMRLPPPSPLLPRTTVIERASTELLIHLPILRMNLSSRIILTCRILPSPGSLELDAEINERLRDLSLMHLANERELESHDVLSLIAGCRDGAGGLMVVSQYRVASSPVIAMEVRYAGNPEFQRTDFAVRT
ncbi:Hypothetical protein D9617_7g030010 [Elsinoe fawcettii]|nr:Hypothetical protein D9617_7g030010 [Elsinoe fawcettii]